ncbi:MAG: peptidyl-prolyl cis-trans isomerase [Trueperaceae bacterium]|nr:peptidyl-prolyl cis-trans isomerase [Trueperaceae bacterium]
MRLSRRTNTIILWIVSIGLLVGMVITFTPTLGAIGGQTDTSVPALRVDGETLTELDVAQVRSSSTVFDAVREGPVATDLERLLVATVVEQEVLRQAAASQRIGVGQVRAEVEAFRERNGVDGSANDEAYLRLIGGAGYTDATFRDYVREQLQVAAYRNELVADVALEPGEAEAYYEANEGAYQTEPTVVARQIVVSDVDVAEDVRARVQAGEAFADVAREVSLERAEQGGAVGGDTPQPVGRPAFPSQVADAVFARTTPGVTPPIQAAGGVYLVDVERIVPAETRPLDEVRDQVEADALAAKRNAVVEAEIERLVAEAEVEAVEGSDLPVDDPVAARVGDREILTSDLVRATYTNPQIRQSLGPQTATLIFDFFRPTILEQLVDGALAVQGADDLEPTFVGSRDQIAQAALDYVSRDADADDEEIRAYYEDNLDRYTVPASADVERVDFEVEADARAFRDAVLAGDDVEAAADATNGTYEDVGVVQRGTLETALDVSLFDTDAYTPLDGDARELSDVLVLEPTALASPSDASPSDASPTDAPTETYVVLVAERVEERVRPLDEVRSDAEARVLAEERQALQREWLDGLRETIDVEVLVDTGVPTPTVSPSEAIPTPTDLLDGTDPDAPTSD